MRPRRERQGGHHLKGQHALRSFDDDLSLDELDTELAFSISRGVRFFFKSKGLTEFSTVVPSHVPVYGHAARAVVMCPMQLARTAAVSLLTGILSSLASRSSSRESDLAHTHASLSLSHSLNGCVQSLY